MDILSVRQLILRTMDPELLFKDDFFWGRPITPSLKHSVEDSGEHLTYVSHFFCSFINFFIDEKLLFK